jgi:hypothetical protein
MRASILIVFMLAGVAVAQEVDPSVLKETAGVASRSLELLSKLATSQGPKTFGFESAKEVSEVKLGDPIGVFMVQLDDLGNYQAGTDPNKLLKPINKVIYPLLAREQVRSSIVVQKTDESWQATDFGGLNLIKLLTQARQKSGAKSRTPPGSCFAIQIPALNAYFIGYRDREKKLMLSSVIDDPTLELSAEETLPAEEVFRKLAPIAKKHNGLPM